MGNHNTTTIAEESKEEIAETITKETLSGFHMLEIHMASVASTATLMMILFCWCICASLILAKCRPMLGRLWWRATRGNKKRRMRQALRKTMRAQNFTLRPWQDSR